MKRCLAVIVLSAGFALLATESRAQTYKPCFDDPVFEESSFSEPAFEVPEFEPGKRIDIQFEKPVFEVQYREQPKYERAIIENPEFVKFEFDDGCTKTVAPVRTPQKVDWFGASYQPKKAPLMQPLVTKKSKAAAASTAALMKPKITKVNTRLIAASKIR